MQNQKGGKPFLEEAAVSEAEQVDGAVAVEVVKTADPSVEAMDLAEDEDENDSLTIKSHATSVGVKGIVQASAEQKCMRCMPSPMAKLLTSLSVWNTACVQ